MNEAPLALGAAPIVEAVIEIDCDMPADMDVDALNTIAVALLADKYPKSRRRLLSEHVISGAAEGSVAVSSRQGLQALQYLSDDENQIVQFRPNGFTFNRLAPCGSLDEYLPEIERTWKLFVNAAKPVLCRTLRLRYINRIHLPLTEGGVEINEYLKVAPALVDEQRLTFVGFFSQQSVFESATGNQANIVMATQPASDKELPVIFDIEATKAIASDPADWAAISGRKKTLRELKNVVFRNSLTKKCLNLFRS
jgi:uncharacterized protein (TIGR04255 family)